MTTEQPVHKLLSRPRSHHSALAVKQLGEFDLFSLI